MVCAMPCHTHHHIIPELKCNSIFHHFFYQHWISIFYDHFSNFIFTLRKKREKGRPTLFPFPSLGDIRGTWTSTVEWNLKSVKKKILPCWGEGGEDVDLLPSSDEFSSFIAFFGTATNDVIIWLYFISVQKTTLAEKLHLLWSV